MSMTISPSTAVAVAFDAPALKAALARIKPALPKAAQHPALYCVRVDVSGSSARLTVTNLDLELTVTVDVSSLDDGVFLVPFARLAKALGVWKTGAVTFHADGERVTVSNRNRSIEVPTEPVDGFPVLRVGDDARTVRLNLDALADVAPAISKDDSRPILASALVEDGAYVATDSYRIHAVETAGSTGAAFLLPRAAVAVATKFSGSCLASVGERYASVQLAPDMELVCRLVDGGFPQWRRLIPNAPVPVVEFDALLAPELETMRKLGFKPDIPVRLAPDAGGVVLSMNETDELKARTVVPGTVAVSAIAFTPAYLLEGLAGMVSTTLTGTDSLKPVMCVDDTDMFGPGGRRLRLLMPVRIS